MFGFNADLSNYYHLEQRDDSNWIIFKNHFPYATIPLNPHTWDPIPTVSPNEQYLVILTPRVIYFIPSDGDQTQNPIESSHQYPFDAYLFTRDSRYFVVSIRDQGIQIYECDPVTRVVNLKHKYPSQDALTIAASPDSKFLYIGSQLELQMYEFATQQITEIEDWQGDSNIKDIYAITVSPDGTQIAGILHYKNYYLLCDDILNFTDAHTILIQRNQHDNWTDAPYPIIPYFGDNNESTPLKTIFFALDNRNLYVMDIQNHVYRWLPFRGKLQYTDLLEDWPYTLNLIFNATRTAYAKEYLTDFSKTAFQIQAIADLDFRDIIQPRNNR